MFLKIVWRTVLWLSVLVNLLFFITIAVIMSPIGYININTEYICIWKPNPSPPSVMGAPLSDYSGIPVRESAASYTDSSMIEKNGVAFWRCVCSNFKPKPGFAYVVISKPEIKTRTSEWETEDKKTYIAPN